MGGRKPLLPCSVVLSAVNGLLSLVPFIFLWLVVRTLLTADGNLADTPVWDYAIAAFAVSMANVLLYFAALMHCISRTVCHVGQIFVSSLFFNLYLITIY